MTQQTSQKMKTMTRIKLVNWHYFSNETVSVNGSFLISGENGSGKSTVLDAIQLVLTTNTRKFNPAANEKNKRDLKGYVRCKTGEEGKTYLRDGKAVISYIALEFYEETKDRYFVLGVKLDSPDLDSEIKRKWFCEEGMLDSLSFVVDNKPALDHQFCNRGKKVTFIQQTTEAKERFKRRLGSLENTFFEMIPKSLAFKPMNNIKDFITKFILPENHIDVGVLQSNIRNLRELQKLIEDIKKQIDDLDDILNKYQEIQEKDNEILVIDILIKKAELEHYKEQLSLCEDVILKKKYELEQENNRAKSAEKELKAEQQTQTQLEIAIGTNECAKLIDKLEGDLRLLEYQEEDIEKKVEKLKQQINVIITIFQLLGVKGQLTASEIRVLNDAKLSAEEKTAKVDQIADTVTNKKQELVSENATNDIELNKIQENIAQLEKEIEALKMDRITYPSNVEFLKKAIEDEFEQRKIQSDVRIFADLLEISDRSWQNAVEGYLHTQRFALIVDPAYYDIAADTYDRIKDKVHSALLVSTQKLDLRAKPATQESLAFVVKSTNRYAKAYADYLLGRVIRCDTVEELKEHNVAITQGCMLHQSKSLRKIDEAIYRVPYIGKYARKKQLEVKTEDKRVLAAQKDQRVRRKKELGELLLSIDECHIPTVRESLYAPSELLELKNEYSKKKKELEDAKKNPSIIELTFKLDECKKRVESAAKKVKDIETRITNLNRDIEDKQIERNDLTAKNDTVTGEISKLGQNHEAEVQAADMKLSEHQKTKSANTIKENYGRRREVLVNQKSKKHDELTKMQTLYRGGEFGTGEELISVYAEEADKLKRYELIQYEEKLQKAKFHCELEFRENFLAKMRENIESAELIFKDLNKSLKSIYYGNDSYRFLMSAKKEKQSLYTMITSDMNIGGTTLFSQQFEGEYRAEMDDLFLKLTESDAEGEGILREYTDYREYLDYDIEIVSKDGKSQYFSKIYGEKSGGETQTPYYVAIAASFSQLYKYGETIRIIMLDEAFDKMDDDRIASMMQFFRDQQFQIILATPPAKMEIIGEYVDTVLMTYRNGSVSTIEEYDL